MGTNILNLIKGIVTRNYPEGRTLNGNEFERGRQSLAIEIADVIDPINEENTKPSAVANVGDVLFKGVMPARPKNTLGAIKNPTFSMQNNECSLILFSIPFEDVMNEEYYEVTIKKVERPKEQDKPNPKLKRRAKKDDDDVQEGLDNNWQNLAEQYVKMNMELKKNEMFFQFPEGNII